MKTTKTTLRIVLASICVLASGVLPAITARSQITYTGQQLKITGGSTTSTYGVVVDGKIVLSAGREIRIEPTTTVRPTTKLKLEIRN